MVKVPLVPLLTVTSSAVKPVTASLNVNVNVTLPLVVVPDTLSVMATVGGVVSAGAEAPPPHAAKSADTAVAATVRPL
jgi:hypothetical protein